MGRGWMGSIGVKRNVWEGCKIAVFATLAAVAYGILHDQVTAHVCVEYFTIAHPPVFPTESPFWLAIGWGIIATWWVGLPLGIALALAARIGSPPKLALSNVRRRIVGLMVVSGISAVIAGCIGVGLRVAGIDTVSGWGRTIPADRLTLFAFDAWAHSASYLCGALGGLVVIILTIRQRLKPPLPR